MLVEGIKLLQYKLHTDLLRNKSLSLIKAQGRLIAAPNVQRQIIAAAILGKFYSRLV